MDNKRYLIGKNATPNKVNGETPDGIALKSVNHPDGVAENLEKNYIDINNSNSFIVGKDNSLFIGGEKVGRVE